MARQKEQDMYIIILSAVASNILSGCFFLQYSNLFWRVSALNFCPLLLHCAFIYYGYLRTTVQVEIF